jgi:hypothetical protein
MSTRLKIAGSKAPISRRLAVSYARCTGDGVTRHTRLLTRPFGPYSGAGTGGSS